jgi:FkbM family methyltransferase
MKKRTRKGWTALAVTTAVALLAGSAGAETPKPKNLLMFNGIAVGEVWEGPEKPLYSQGNEEVIIRHYFKDKRDGFFLDVGCSEPIKNNNSYYLEKHLGWSGIGIDALPEHAEAYKKERPRTKFLNFFVTDYSGGMVDFERVIGATGLSSTEKDRTAFGMKFKTETIQVPASTLNDILEKEGVTRIDYMNLDIEGGAPKALAGFDIERYQPQLVCAEFPGIQEFLQDYFTKHGYERIEEYRKYDYVNWYYRPVKRAEAEVPK